jgi:putative selenium metabolism protein SsnA
MASTELLIGPATLVPGHPPSAVMADCGVVCAQGRITAVGRWSELRKEHAGAEHLDVGGRVVLPGLVNAHHHLYSTFARGMPLAEAATLGNFTQVLEGIWWRLDRALDLEAVQAGAWPPVLDSLRWGTTTIIDHHASPSAIRGSLDALAKVCSACGLRAALCYEITDRNGLQDARVGLEENLAFARNPGSGHLRGLLGLHASFTVSDETLALAARAIPADMPIHVHVAEDAADQELSRKLFGQGPVQRLQAHGLLRAASVLVHGVHLSDDELRAIAKAGAFLVHNPESNANNAVGALDIVHAMELGVAVALGTDGMASNMLRAAKSAYLMARHVRRDPSQGIDLCRRLLLGTNMQLARLLFNDPSIGTLGAGAPADLCVVDYVAPTPVNDATLDGHMTFGITECPVFATVAQGVVRFCDGRFRQIDTSAIQQRVLAAAQGVWSRLRP